MPSMKDQTKIVIVGGVAGGMSAATRARRLDENASITVFERGPYVSYANCGIPYALGGEIEDDASLLLQSPQALKSRFNIDVYTCSEALDIDRTNQLIYVRSDDHETITKVSYDKLILSQGAQPWRPPIEGIDLPHVFSLHTVPDLKKIKDFLAEKGSNHICIIGGGFIGLETAEQLRNLGNNVTVLEYMSHVFPPIDLDIAESLHSEVRKHGVQLQLNARVKRIEATHVVLEDGSQVEATMVLVLAGVRARTELARKAGLVVGKAGVTVNEFMQTSDPDIYAVGDMVETENRIAHSPMPLALGGPANRQGRLAADHIFGKDIRYRGNVGTSVCRVFDLTIACVGLSVSALRARGQNPLWVTVHPPHHAGYYPAANPITLKIIFERGTGLLLGGQAVGRSGVDKRIDVMSTAIQAGLKIFDLEHLELAYAPPYGSAKDPVNMAGFVGSNLLRGDYELIHPEDMVAAFQDKTAVQKMQIVDVRSPEEFARGHVTGAVNVPIGALRDQIRTLDKAKSVVVYCFVGYRGYLAYRILKQRGFSVVNLDGGFKSVIDGHFETLQAIPSDLGSKVT
jgi:NADPH-dependent 2,4-dienoyl-CoA reductase/sulfur reductase-like enzyme/rhodanese-related sulfurtransferase